MHIFRGLLLIAAAVLIAILIHDISAFDQRRISNVERAATSVEEMRAELRQTQSDLQDMKREAAEALDAMEKGLLQLQSDLDTLNAKKNHDLRKESP